MGAIGYYLYYCFNWLITLLPLKVLYGISDLMFPFMYYFPGYRRKIVRKNLMNSFPGKSMHEIVEIEKKFYHHLCDLFLETFKLSHMSNENIMRRMPIANPELLDRLFNEGRDVVAVLGHYGNWEWLVVLPLYSRFRTVSIYKPLNNKHFDRHMVRIRTRNGMVLTPMQHVVREVLENRNRNIRALYCFLADQKPPKRDIKFWTDFLNQDTPVYLGAEKIASKYDMAVVYFDILKEKRGYYKFTVELLFEHTAGLSEHTITDTHVRRLERAIMEKPEFWIWSHNRWKHKRENTNG
jgi:Kdo2-lipid IVA lauroyltransferase/acyltransferase